MNIDATFWVAVSFFIFAGGLVYLKIPQKINEVLNKERVFKLNTVNNISTYRDICIANTIYSSLN